MVDDLEGGDETEAHAEAEEAACVGHEPDQWDLLVALDAGHHGILNHHGKQHMFLMVSTHLLVQLRYVWKHKEGSKQTPLCRR